MALIPTQQTLQIGGRTFTDLDNLIVLYGAMGGAVNSYSVCRKGSGTAGYTPSGSKKFRVLAFRITIGTAGDAYISYCDNDIGINSGGQGTNPIYPGGDAAMSLMAGNAQMAGALNAGAYIERTIDFLVPNGKFLEVASNGSAAVASVEIFGYEEA